MKPVRMISYQFSFILTTATNRFNPPFFEWNETNVGGYTIAIISTYVHYL